MKELMLFIKESTVDTVCMVLKNWQWFVKENILKPGGIGYEVTMESVFCRRCSGLVPF